MTIYVGNIFVFDKTLRHGNKHYEYDMTRCNKHCNMIRQNLISGIKIDRKVNIIRHGKYIDVSYNLKMTLRTSV